MRYHARVDWKLSLAGLLIGLLVGMTGMGGGSLMTPMLVLVFGFKPTTAIGTDILHGAIFKSFGAVQHRRLGHVHARLTLWMLAGSAPASLAGVSVSEWLKRTYGEAWQDHAKLILGVALLVAGVGFLAKTFVHSHGDDSPLLLEKRDKRNAVIIGLVGGFIVGMTSVGSGTFFGLTMLIMFPLTARKIVGTDIFHAAVLLWVAGFGHLVTGNVDIRATGWLLIGSIPGVLIGGRLTLKLPDRAMRVALATTLFLSGVKLVDFPGANTVIIVGAAVALVAAAGFVVRTMRAREPVGTALVDEP
jgi:uncharacterized membrane protein YfcA